MKRILALTLSVLMIAALFCACGGKTKTESAAGDKKDAAEATTAVAEKVVTTIDAKDDSGFAEKYAKSVTTDENGYKVYEFDGNAYENYTRDYNNTISNQMTSELSKAHDNTYGQFCYINDEKKAVVVGLNPGQYDEKVASKEAATLAKDAFPYFKGLAEKVDTISVIYCNANDQSDVYGSFDFNVE